MTYRGEEGDFSVPDFTAHLDEISQEHVDSVNDLLKAAFSTLSKSEKLMIRPLVDICFLKKKHQTLVDEACTKTLKKELEPEIKELEKKIKSRLHVINENGDIQVLIKRFNLLLFDLNKKKSSKHLAKLGSGALLKFIEQLKHSGELWH